MVDHEDSHTVDQGHITVAHNEVHEHVKDSIHHVIIIRNDTVWDTKYVERIRWREASEERHDTVWRDSIRVEHEYIDKEVIRKVTPKWCYWCLVLCAFSLSAIVLLLRFKK